MKDHLSLQRSRVHLQVRIVSSRDCRPNFLQTHTSNVNAQTFYNHPHPIKVRTCFYLILPGMKSCISLVTNLLHPESIHHSKSSQLSMHDFCESLGLMLWFWVKHRYAKFWDIVALEAISDVMSGGAASTAITISMQKKVMANMVVLRSPRRRC